MARYVEYKTDQQSNLNWGETFKMSVKAPAVADRIFKTWEMANAYVKDVNSSAVAGLILAVIQDGTRNGIYFVNYMVEGELELALYHLSGTQSDWLEENESSMAYIMHRPTGDYGKFYIDSNDVVTETPYAEGYMDYTPPEEPEIL